MRCTKCTFGGSGATLKPWSQALQKMFRPHTDARFVVETMGTAIRALPGVERDHNAHMVRVIQSPCRRITPSASSLPM